MSNPEDQAPETQDEQMLREAEEEEKRLYERLGSRIPLLTILRICLLPMFFQASNGIQDSIDLYFISKGFGDEGVIVVSISAMIRMICTGLTYFHLQSSVVKFNHLLVDKKTEAVGRLWVDMFRMAIIFNIIIVIVFVPASGPFLKAIGLVDPVLRKKGVTYLYPIICGSFFPMMLSVLCSILVAEGKANLSATFQMTSMIITIAADPLIIWGFKGNIQSCGFAYLTGAFICVVIIFTKFAIGKEEIKPVWDQFFKAPTYDFLELLKLSIPELCFLSFDIIGPNINRILMCKRASNLFYPTTGDETPVSYEQDISTVFGTQSRPYTILLQAGQGAVSGYSTCATWAYHKKKYQRMRELMIWGAALPFLFNLIASMIVVFNPKGIMKIWIESERMLDWCKTMTPREFYTVCLSPLNLLLIATNVIFRHTFFAALIPTIKFISYVGTGIIIYAAFPKHPEHFMYAFTVQDCVTFVSASIITYFRYKIAINGSVENEDDQEEKKESNSGEAL